MHHICIIGSGNVAWHLCRHFTSVDTVKSITVLDRNNRLGSINSDKVICINSVKNIPDNADIYILAVKDIDINGVVSELFSCIPLKANIVHTSGTAMLDSLLPFENRGCMWPVQSLTKGIDLNAERIPFAICANNSLLVSKMEKILKDTHAQVYPIDESAKVHLHLGAVIINNFTNHIYHLTEEYLLSKNLPINILNPLLRYTIDKLDSASAFESQTGPARRGDKETLDKQISLLAHNEVLGKLYKLMNASIEKTYNNK